MHELAIADAILAIATEHARGRRLAAVTVRVGHLRQVVPSALEFSFELLAPGVELEIVEVPTEGRCRTCDVESVQPRFPFSCPACGGLDVEVVRGEELAVESLEVEVDAEGSLTMSGRRSDER